MKITLTKEEKTELLKAVAKGELDTAKIPRLFNEIKGVDRFMELMMELDEETTFD